jgi:hypothetical protein
MAGPLSIPLCGDTEIGVEALEHGFINLGRQQVSRGAVVVEYGHGFQPGLLKHRGRAAFEFGDADRA